VDFPHPDPELKDEIIRVIGEIEPQLCQHCQIMSLKILIKKRTSVELQKAVIWQILSFVLNVILLLLIKSF